MLGGHVRAVFTLVTFIFIFCVTVTITSFREIPLWQLESQPQKLPNFLNDDVEDVASPSEKKPPETDDGGALMTKTTSYGSLSKNNLEIPTDFVRFYMKII